MRHPGSLARRVAAVAVALGVTALAGVTTVSRATADDSRVTSISGVGAALGIGTDGTLVWVTDYAGAKVRAIDPTTGSVVGQVGVGVGPNDVAALGTRLYVANSISTFLSVVDTTTRTATSLSLGVRQDSVVTLGQKVYVSAPLNAAVKVIDTANGNAVTTVPVSFSPHGMAVVGSKVYVAAYRGSVVAVIDTANGNTVSTVIVEPYPSELAAVGTDVYVTTDAGVQVIHTAAGNTVTTLPGFIWPADLAVDGDLVYVADQDADNPENDAIKVIDTARGNAVSTLLTGLTPTAITVQDGRLWAALFADGAAAVRLPALSAGTVSGILGQPLQSDAPTPSWFDQAVTYTLADGQTLPVGLTLDPDTGVISGTPQQVQAATHYTLVATDSGGVAHATVTLTVGPATPTVALADQTWSLADVPVDPGATTTGDGAISYTVVDAGTSACQTVGDLVVATAVGTCQVQATSAATARYTAAQAVATITVIDAPGAPTIVRTVPLRGRVVVQISTPDDNGSPITSYGYSVDGGATWTSRPDIATAFTVTGLRDAQDYALTVRAVNAAGYGPAATPVSVTPQPAAAAPATASAPTSSTDLTATSPTVDVSAAAVTVVESTVVTGFRAVAETGDPVQPATGGVLVLPADGVLQIFGSGMAPGTRVDVWAGGTTSLGSAVVATDGTYLANLSASALTPGAQTLELNGLAADLTTRTVTLESQVLAATPDETAADTSNSADTSGALAATGFDALRLLGAAAGLVTSGVLVVSVTRPRRRGRHCW